MIRKARMQDAEELTGITLEAKRDWGYPEEYVTLWREALTITPEDLQESIAYVNEEEGVIEGYYLLSKEEGKWYLSSLFIRPSCRGRGMGTALFAHAAQTARGMGAKCLRIVSDPVVFGEEGRKRPELSRRAEAAQEARSLPLVTYALK